MALIYRILFCFNSQFTYNKVNNHNRFIRLSYITPNYHIRKMRAQFRDSFHLQSMKKATI